jgi:hypothetical protein
MKVLVSCATENRPDWLARVESLLLSLREFGGSLARSAFVVNVVGAPPYDWARRLEELGATLRVVERHSDGNACANKLRMLELAGEADFDVLLMLDCDIVVAGDPLPWARLDRVAAKPVDIDFLRSTDWRRLIEAVPLPGLRRELRASSTGRPTYPYFNSGVIFVPRALCGPLGAAWVARHDQLLGFLEDGTLSTRLRFFSEQLAFAVALGAEGIPCSPLPVGLNFPTHVRVHSSALRERPAPLVLHYHAELDEDGFLLRPVAAEARDAAERVNRARADALGIDYSGAATSPLPRRVARAQPVRRLREALLVR